MNALKKEGGSKYNFEAGINWTRTLQSRGGNNIVWENGSGTDEKKKDLEGSGMCKRQGGQTRPGGGGGERGFAKRDIRLGGTPEGEGHRCFPMGRNVPEGEKCGKVAKPK